MKRIIFPVAFMFILAACGGGGEQGADGESTAPASMVQKAGDEHASNPDYINGKALIEREDCLTCHTEKEKIIGPTYLEVAQKYAGADAAQIDTMAMRIINGSTGIWGEVPMTPHPNLGMEEARQMVRYVLLVQ